MLFFFWKTIKSNLQTVQIYEGNNTSGPLIGVFDGGTQYSYPIKLPNITSFFFDCKTDQSSGFLIKATAGE